MADSLSARQLARLFDSYDERLKALERGARTGQLQNASITGTSITVYDEDGSTRRGAIGLQADGTIGLVAVNGPAPAAPSAPAVTPSLAGLRITWDGTFADGSAVPADFAHVAVHVSTETGFTPSVATFAGTITKAGDGGMLPVTPLPYQPHYVRLVGVNTSGIPGDPSDETSGTPLQVDGPDLVAGSVTAGAIAAGAVTADKLEAILTLATRIVAGNPEAARVEFNEDGLRVYDADNVLKIQFDAAAGSGVFTGTITASDITGSTATSLDFSDDSESGIIGWRLSADGTVEIRNLIVGNDAYSISETGAAAFQQVSADEVYLPGGAVSALLDALPRGVLQVVQLTGVSATTPVAGANNNTLFLRSLIPEVEARQYEVTLHAAHINPGSATPTYIGIRVFAAYGTDASPTDKQVATFQSRSTAVSNDSIAPITFTFSPDPAHLGEDVHFAWYVYASSMGVNFESELDGISCLVVKDIGPAAEVATYDVSQTGTGGGDEATTTYVKTYNPVWSGSWSEAGSRTANHAWQGRYDGTQGIQYAKWGFPSQIQTDLAGATIDKIELYLKNEFFYANAGGDAMIGTHATASEPSGSSSTSGNWDRVRVHFDVGQAKWVNLGVSTFGADFKSGAARGITLGDPSTGSLSLYGYFRRYDTNHPQLRITYRK